MKSATQSLAHELPNVERERNEAGFFSSESVLNILKLILAGSDLAEVLTIIARLVESQGEGTFCTILASRCRRKASILRSRARPSWVCRKHWAHIYWPERRLLRHSRLS